jgi:hypothetical protein
MNHPSLAFVFGVTRDSTAVTAQNIFCMSTIKNMATMQIFAVKGDEICS